MSPARTQRAGGSRNRLGVQGLASIVKNLIERFIAFSFFRGGLVHIPELYSTREVAEKFKLTERAVWRLTGSGELHPIKIGNKNRYTEADLMDFLARHNPGLVHPDDEEMVED